MILKFLRKNRFNIFIVFLILLFIFVSYFMLWVHLPYSQNQNAIKRLENQIVQANEYSDVEYFDRYDSDKSYYIIHATKDDKKQYAVFDDKAKFIKSYSEDVVDQQVCIDDFINRYNVEPDKVTIGYENEIFVYSLMYQGKDSLIYAFYGIDTGDFVKAYRIDNG